MSVDIWSILYISEVEEMFRVKFRLALIWQDPRLQYFNLKNDSDLNIVAPREAEMIWYPHVIFLNTQNNDQSVVIQFVFNFKNEFNIIFTIYSMTRALQ